MDIFSTSMQAVVIGLYAVAVIGSFEIVQDLKQSRRETKERASVASILSRALRHNFRNDLTVIRGYTEMMEESDEHSIIQEKIDGLIETSEKARTLEESISSQSRSVEIELTDVIQQISDDVCERYPLASIEMSAPTSMTITTLPSLESAIYEVVENAAKHAGEIPEIEISVEDKGNNAVIRVRDNGPGIPSHETALLDSDSETPLHHSSGIGLWMTRWIIQRHGGELTFENSESGTELKIVLPTFPLKRTENTVEPQGVPGRYRAIFENDVNAVLIVDHDHHILDANPRAGTLFATPVSDLLGMPLSSVPVEQGTLTLSWDDLDQECVHEGTVTIATQDGQKLKAAYFAIRDIIIGEHLMIIHPATEHSQIV